MREVELWFITMVTCFLHRASEDTKLDDDLAG